MLWTGTADTIPAGYVLCDGKNNTPDLRNRFIVGAAGDFTAGSSGGQAEQTITFSQTTQSLSDSDVALPGIYRGSQAKPASEPSGVLVANPPLYYALCYIMKV